MALLDVEMPGLDGIAATAALRAAVPECRVLVVTTFGRPGYLRRAMEAGAGGFVVKDTPAAPARRRGPPGARRAAGGRPDAGRRDAGQRASPLTARETEVLRAARDGGTVADIAGRLHLSEGTVRNHLSAAIGKTGARTRAEAVRLADEQRLALTRRRAGPARLAGPRQIGPGVIGYSTKSTSAVPGTVTMTSSGALPTIENPAFRSQESPAVTWYWPAGSSRAYLPRASVVVWVSPSCVAFTSHANRT